jgi:hypothetical protein
MGGLWQLETNPRREEEGDRAWRGAGTWAGANPEWPAQQEENGAKTARHTAAFSLRPESRSTVTCTAAH